MLRDLLWTLPTLPAVSPKPLTLTVGFFGVSWAPCSLAVSACTYTGKQYRVPTADSLKYPWNALSQNNKETNILILLYEVTSFIVDG